MRERHSFAENRRSRMPYHSNIERCHMVEAHRPRHAFATNEPAHALTKRTPKISSAKRIDIGSPPAPYRTPHVLWRLNSSGSLAIFAATRLRLVLREQLGRCLPFRLFLENKRKRAFAL